MNRLHTIELSDFLRLNGVKTRALRAGSVRYLLDGGIVDQSIPIAGGELVLEGYRSGSNIYGFFTGTQIDGINLLRASGQTVDLVHHLGSWRVKVKSVDVVTVRNVVDPSGDDLYVGTITLLIV